ncbi:polymer-forming cytoskeletal protein [Methylobacillus gramineus]|uniref:bactofilin family protein n=1 Tax=Methylobacillus gramineus TaxID=755169 RepID=UPI001CFFCA8F|nr:polymer-forming cytoskeletal protein [Methylobacillus gramineus]MCB5185654.1 polymer-forming cytoskeletal protein [Methylobacillus gramineus]
MFSKNKNKPQSRIDTLIGAETRLEGNISFSGGLRVDGSIKGDVTEADTPSMLIVQGKIEGSVTVAHIVLNGQVTGPVHASQYLELHAKSRINGDVYYKSLEIHTGAIIEGKLVYIGDAVNANTTVLPVDKD